MDRISDDETTPLAIAETPKPRKKNCCHVLREEFRWRNFCFDFPTASVFYRSQWRWPRLVMVVFRLCLALYTGIICVLTIVYFPRKNPEVPWIVWLTNWSYLLLTLHEVLSAAIVLVHSTDRTTGWCCRELEYGARQVDDDENGWSDGRAAGRRTDDQSSVPFYMKLDWLLFCVAAPVAVLVLLMNLVTLEPDLVTVKGLNNHFLNGVVVLLEFCVGALPVRLLHFVYFAVYFAIYSLFAYILWSFDHTVNVVYPGFIDWNYPQSTLIRLVVMCFVLAPIMQIFLFLLYRLRLFIFRKIYGDEERGYEDIYDY